MRPPRPPTAPWRPDAGVPWRPDAGVPWRPGAGLEALRARARMLRQVRDFFAARDVLEVETPLLCQDTVTDPHLDALPCVGRWLQTSPEYAMKRLLAAGCGAIYQVCKAFRAGEAGRRHNPEFTMLEWYRPGFNLAGLMDEVADLTRAVLGPLPEERATYQALFQTLADVDPFSATAAEMETLARSRLAPAAAASGAAGSEARRANATTQGADRREARRAGGAELDLSALTLDRDGWLDLLMTHLVEPGLAGRGMVFVHDFPASQAALAQVCPQRGVARRFELYVAGVELANGYLELLDTDELARRWEADNAQRAALGKETRAPDQRLLQAMAAGLPPCAGVALGLDRLLMLKLGCADMDATLSFSWARA